MTLPWIDHFVQMPVCRDGIPRLLADVPRWADHVWLLARRHDLRGLSEGFRGRSVWDNAPQTALIALIILFVAVGLLLVGRYVNRYEESHATNSPADLFRELCRIHHLSGADRRLLKRLATRWELESPGRLFIQPELFDATRLPTEMQLEAEHVERLRTHLFGDDK